MEGRQLWLVPGCCSSVLSVRWKAVWYMVGHYSCIAGWAFGLALWGPVGTICHVISFFVYVNKTTLLRIKWLYNSTLHPHNTRDLANMRDLISSFEACQKRMHDSPVVPAGHLPPNICEESSTWSAIECVSGRQWSYQLLNLDFCPSSILRVLDGASTNICISWMRLAAVIDRDLEC